MRGWGGRGRWHVHSITRSISRRLLTYIRSTDVSGPHLYVSLRRSPSGPAPNPRTASSPKKASVSFVTSRTNSSFL